MLDYPRFMEKYFTGGPCRTIAAELGRQAPMVKKKQEFIQRNLQLAWHNAMLNLRDVF